MVSGEVLLFHVQIMQIVSQKNSARLVRAVLVLVVVVPCNVQCSKT